LNWPHLLGCLELSPNLAEGRHWLGKSRGANLGINLDTFFKNAFFMYFLFGNQTTKSIHTLQAHIDGSFAKKALLSRYVLSKRGLIFLMFFFSFLPGVEVEQMQ